MYDLLHHGKQTTDDGSIEAGDYVERADFQGVGTRNGSHAAKSDGVYERPANAPARHG